MDAGTIYDFTDESVVQRKLLEVRRMFDGGQSFRSHETRMRLLAPMYIRCSDEMKEIVQAHIEESISRSTYELMRVK